MPRLDGTGPAGEGPLTGRGMGNCENTVSNQRPTGMGMQRGFRRGNGLGRGMGQMRGNKRGQNR